MFADLSGVALRQNSVYIPDDLAGDASFSEIKPNTLFALGQLRQFGFSLTERALRGFNRLSPEQQGKVLELLSKIYAVNMNWTPLVRDWLVPTGQTWVDMFYTFLYNVADYAEGGTYPGTRLKCGHLIPDGVFDLPRYNGCPFCGKPFETSDTVNFGGSPETRLLDSMGDKAMASLMRNLVEMRTPLDATQLASLRTLLNYYPLPDDVDIRMKETLVAVMYFLVDAGKPERLLGLVKSPADVLRYLWYCHTGQEKVIRPATLVKLSEFDWLRFCPSLDEDTARIASERLKSLRLHFPRKLGRIVAWLFNTMEMPAEEMCRIMHPQREIWVHMFRALHLPEYARRKGSGKLARVLDRFYRGDYLVPQGAVDKARAAGDFKTTMELLRLRPGAFARQLFANMLYFDADKVVDEFRKVIPDLSTRLVISLGNAAQNYFNPNFSRPVRIITGRVVQVMKNPLLASYTDAQLQDMIIMVKGLLNDALSIKYGMMPSPAAGHIFIDPVLDNCVMPVSDRSISVQDVGSALPGMVFPVKGDKVRLFLYWGEGMPAQALDLDLSALILYDGDARSCDFRQLTRPGAQHSGDIRWIPDNVGTAEYVELDLRKLLKSGARYVVFSATNYSGGPLPANTRIGWMSSKYRMKVSEENGVAFDPSCVQMMIRLPENTVSRTMHFGILDVEKKEITYVEYPDNQQVVGEGAEVALSMLEKLKSKLTIGKALHMMAAARGLAEVSAEQIAADAALAADTVVYDSSCLSDIPGLMRTLIPD